MLCDTFLVSLAVSSARAFPRFLAMNIPHNDGIDACRHFLNTRLCNASPSKTETLCDLISMILTMNNFYFDDKTFLQIHGTAMGTEMAPSYANPLLTRFETNV